MSIDVPDIAKPWHIARIKTFLRIEGMRPQKREMIEAVNCTRNTA